MSRLDKLQKASFTALLSLLVAGPAVSYGAETPDELRSRARSTTDVDQVVKLAKDLRRAGLTSDALAMVGKAFAKARGDGPVSALRLELARTYLDLRLPKKATNECL